MQGYRGGNRQRLGIACLLGLWLALLPALVMGQPMDNDDLPWYIPESSSNSQYISSPYIIHYTSWADLAEKLVARAGKPYHLSLVLGKNTPADWAALRTIPPVASLSIELADSVMSTQLLPILATWPALKKLAISTVFSGSQSFTIVTNAKGGETTFGSKPTQKKLAQSGWAALRSLNDVKLTGDIDFEQAVRVLQACPVLESLGIQSFAFGRNRNVPVVLSGMTRLKRLTLEGTTRQFAAAFKGLPGLTQLIVYDPAIADLNDGLPYLTGLQSLHVTTFSQSNRLHELRLGRLTNLQTLLICGRAPSPMSLDSTLAGLTTLKSLAIEQIKLRGFPVNLLANKSLTHLSMPDADLAGLPDRIAELSALEELIIDNNPLHRLPDALCRLGRLRRLSASKCELDSLPVAIGQLTSLTGLALNSNLLVSLPASVGQLRELRQLNVAMNQLAELPAELGRLPKLETIAAFWNRITRFPAGLTQVRELYLTDNLLTELPASLGTLTNLQTLLLDNNPLTHLPESLGQLQSLETLVLGNNQLTTLPRSIGSLRQLQRFVLGENQVRDLPETIGGLTSLTSVSLSDNPISRLPASVGYWQKLTFVQLKLPQLEALPEQLGRWQALKTLSVESDKLVVIPHELTDCGQLADLSVTGKRLIGLPETLGKLTQLERLSLEGRVDTLTGQGRGQVIALPASLANCKELTTLLVLNQQQFDGVEGIQLAANLPRLKHLTFINCGITDLSGIAWRNLSAATLNLSQNRFSQLPAALLEMPNLEQANLSETNLPQHLNQFFLRKEKLVEALKKTAE